MIRKLPWGAPVSWYALKNAGDKYSTHWWLVLLSRLAPIFFPLGEEVYWKRWLYNGDRDPLILTWHSLLHYAIGLTLALPFVWLARPSIAALFVFGFAIGKELEDGGDWLKKSIDIISFTLGGSLPWMISWLV